MRKIPMLGSLGLLMAIMAYGLLREIRDATWRKKDRDPARRVQNWSAMSASGSLVSASGNAGPPEREDVWVVTGSYPSRVQGAFDEFRKSLSRPADLPLDSAVPPPQTVWLVQPTFPSRVSGNIDPLHRGWPEKAPLPIPTAKPGGDDAFKRDVDSHLRSRHQDAPILPAVHSDR